MASPKYLQHVSDNSNAGSNSTSAERDGLKRLLRNISRGAFYDADEQEYPLPCHPRTQIAIRAEIMEWIQANPKGKQKPILWMYGPTRSGKTDIARSIAEECEEQGLLAASFFFAHTDGCNDASRFIATIAYQLSQSIPETFNHIVSAIERDPIIFSLSLATQMRVLIIEPLKFLPPSTRPVFIIADGIDKCGPNRESPTVFLNAMWTAISEIWHVPLIFLITSQLEDEIHRAFNGNLLHCPIKSLALHDTYVPDHDIKVYLKSAFRGIYDKRCQLGNRLPSPWPADDAFNWLVSKASGLLVFATMAMKFIDSPRSHPQRQLDIILGLSATGNETPFALLDALYHYILSSTADPYKVLQILRILILSTPHYEFQGINLNVEMIEELLGFAIGPVLVDMHALVHVPLPTDHISNLRIHHASLRDFLTDRSRSRDYYIDIEQGHIALTRRWLAFIASYPHTSSRLSLHLCVSGFLVHSRKLSMSSYDVADILSSFWLKNALEGLRMGENLFCVKWESFFGRIKKQAGTHADIFIRLRDEFDAFILGCISQYPPALQVLIPVILVHERKLPPSGIFCLFFHAMHPSLAQFAQIQELDSTLLNLYKGCKHTNLHVERNRYFATLFGDRSRAGRFYVDGRSWATLAKRMIWIVFARSEKAKYKVAFVGGHRCVYEFNSLDDVPTIKVGVKLLVEWFSYVGFPDWTDVELAVLLREYVLQYDDCEFAEEHHTIAKIGLEYIKRCHIPYLDHTHLPKTNRCIVCDEVERAMDDRRAKAKRFRIEAERRVEAQRRAEAERAEAERRIEADRRAEAERRIEADRRAEAERCIEDERHITAQPSIEVEPHEEICLVPVRREPEHDDSGSDDDRHHHHHGFFQRFWKFRPTS